MEDSASSLGKQIVLSWHKNSLQNIKFGVFDCCFLMIFHYNDCRTIFIERNKLVFYPVQKSSCQI
jgi:hypothetical protein